MSLRHSISAKENKTALPVKKNRLSWLLPAAGVLCGAVILGIGAMNLYRSIACKGWPHTEGTIQSARIETVKRRKGSDRYRPSISYHYQANGIPYYGTRLNYGISAGAKVDAETFLLRYPPGKPVQVFYSPTKPQEAVLETGIYGGVWSSLGLGGFFVTLSLVLLIAGKKLPNRPRA